MYKDIVLNSYTPVFEVLRQYGVETIIFKTYANARILIPLILKWGFNCLYYRKLLNEIVTGGR